MVVGIHHSSSKAASSLPAGSVVVGTLTVEGAVSASRRGPGFHGGLGLSVDAKTFQPAEQRSLRP